MSDPQAILLKIAERLRTVLDPTRFQFEPRPDIQGHGGVAVGYFTQPPFRIGLMVRGDFFESVMYEWGDAVCAHLKLVRALGREKDARLRWDREHGRLTTRRRLFSREQPDVVEALMSDLANIIVPALEKDAGALRQAIEVLHAESEISMENRESFPERPCPRCGELLDLENEAAVQHPSEEPWRIQCANCGEELTPDDVRP